MNKRRIITLSIAGVVVVGGASLLYYKNQAKQDKSIQATYAKQDKSFDQTIQAIKSAQKAKSPYVVIAHRTDCLACEIAEELIMQTIIKNQLTTSTPKYIVTDIQKYTPSQTQKFKSEVVGKERLIDNEIPTPLIIRYNGQGTVVKSTDTNDETQIKNILNNTMDETEIKKTLNN